MKGEGFSPFELIGNGIKRSLPQLCRNPGHPFDHLTSEGHLTWHLSPITPGWVSLVPALGQGALPFQPIFKGLQG